MAIFLRQGFRYSWYLCCALVFIGLFGGPFGSAAQEEPAADGHILILYAYGYGGRGVELFSEGFFNTLTEASFPVSNVYAEYLDLQRNKEIPDYLRKMSDSLHWKYAQRRIDLIITVQQPALDFLFAEGKDIAPEAPVITIQGRSLSAEEKMGRRMIGEVNQFDIKGTLQLALDLFPQTRHVVFVSGSSVADLKVAEQAAHVAENFQRGLEFEYTTNMTLQDILKRISRLPPRSIIIFTQYNRDSQDRIALAYEVENMIVKSANAPVFGLYDYNLRNGGLGGSVIPVETLGVQAGKEALDILKGIPMTAENKLLQQENVPMFDWQRIRRWGGDVSRMPANTIFLNRPPSEWQQYRNVIIGTVFFSLFQTVFIFLLLGNISRRKRAEKVLAKREADFHAIFDGIFDAVIFTDAERRICLVNPAFIRVFGYTPEEVLGRTTEFLYQDQAGFSERGQHFFHRAPGAESGVYEQIYKRKDGGEFLAETSGTRIVDQDGEVVGFLGVNRDITERIRAKEALLESEAQYRRIFDTAAEGIWGMDAKRRTLFVNPRMAAMLGYKPEEMPGKLFDDFLYEEDLIDHFLHMEAQKEGKSDQYERRLRHKDGGAVFTHVSATTMVDNKGQFSGSFGMFTDISERKKIEEALRESNEKFTLAFNNAPVVIAISNLDDGIYLDINQRFLDVFGFSREEAVGKSSRELGILTQSRRDELINVIKEKGKIENVDLVMSTKSGKEVLFKYWGERITIGNRNRLLSISLDITEHRKTENQLQQAQKMESVGRLAGGVAHDFNNMLGVILGHSEMAMAQINSAEPLFADLEEIRKAAIRSADLTRQLLAFARKQTVAPKILDLNETIEGMLKMLRRIIGEDIDLIWMPGGGLWPVKVDPSQVDQILANLCVNARDAIAGVGKIIVETGNVIIDDEYCAAHTGVVAGEYVRISVSDTGCGMDKQTLAHIFEPFFTTKDVGAGTGLGLATVYGAVQQNNGFVNVYSEPGQGTIFTISLPRHADAGMDGQAPREGEMESAAGGHETILLVEDEPAILKITATMLKRLGYTVLAVNAPGEAVRLMHDFTADIHLLMTDVIMPEMNGRDLADQLTALNKGMRCLFMSGYTSDIIASQGILTEGIHFIQKPFSQKELAASIREILD